MRYRQGVATGWWKTAFARQWLPRWRVFATENRPRGETAAPPDGGVSCLEALLFLSHQPLTSRKLSQLAGLADGTKARTLVRTLNRRYDARGSAFRVEEVGGGYQLRTRAKFAPWLRRLHAVPTEVRLSPAVLETLAVVAYRQPVPRAEIDAIRGVQSGEVLRQLIDRELVRVAGRSDDLGRPFLYGTTKRFLQVFGLRHLDELPRAGVLRPKPPPSIPENDTTNTSDSTVPNLSNPSPAVEEEENVKTVIPTSRREVFDAQLGLVARPRYNERPVSPTAYSEPEDEDEDEDEFEDDDEFEDEDEEEGDEDEDLDEEPWEEVGDDDLDEEDEDWDEDEDEDEDWEDEDWDEDEEDEEEDESDDE
ncbi:MAG: SMC-Scp complex subunit ScpB [Thermoguttaceae bacterium]